MMPLMQKILGSDWDKLPQVIRQQYQIPSANQNTYIVSGKLFVDYPWFVAPILKLVRLFGGLIDFKGQNLPASVEKWVDPSHADCLFWRRTISLTNDKVIVFSSRMEYRGQNRLVEIIGGGFGLNLNVSVADGRLVYQSDGHFWRFGVVTIPIPDIFFLGHATFSETIISDDQFELDFTIKHPLFGVTYRYGGVFTLAEI